MERWIIYGFVIICAAILITTYIIFRLRLEKERAELSHMLILPDDLCRIYTDAELDRIEKEERAKSFPNEMLLEAIAFEKETRKE